jgi:hypothetical protein
MAKPAQMPWGGSSIILCNRQKTDKIVIEIKTGGSGFGENS